MVDRLIGVLVFLGVCVCIFFTRESFNATAKYWTQAYAGASMTASGTGRKGVEQGDDAIALAGLSKDDVLKFENVSVFPRDESLYRCTISWLPFVSSDSTLFFLHQMGFERNQIVSRLLSVVSFACWPVSHCLVLFCMSILM